MVLSSVLLVVLAQAASPHSVWLSSLDLSKAKQGWGSPQKDRSVDRHAITLRGRTFEHGFGTHSPALLIVELEKGSARFEATVGIDDEVGSGRGSAVFEVLNDRHGILWSSGLMREGDQPKECSVGLKGLKEIALRVTDGGDGFDYDHADWADAKFVVTGALPETSQPRTAVPVISEAKSTLAPVIHGPSLVAIRAGTPLNWKVPETGERPIHFSAKDLPAGLKLDPESGILTGIAGGTANAFITAANTYGRATAKIHIESGEGVAATPPMGWNSYDCFGDDVTESEVLSNARYVAKDMQPYGWDTIVVDYRWYDPGASKAPNNTGARAGADLTMDEYGRLLPSPNRFPSARNGQGFEGLANQLHRMGLKLGIHIMRGIPRNAVKAHLPIEGSSYKAEEAANTNDPCPWCPDMWGVRGNTPAGQAYYDSIFRLYASWGVDYVKMDDTSSPYHTDEVEAVHNAIVKCGRSIVFSLSPGETPIEDAFHVEGHANMWRVSGDFWDNWDALLHEFALGAKWRSYVGAGHWPDADMLPLGHVSVRNRSVGPDRHTNFTKAEQVTLLSLWCLLPSPLMVGGNLPDNDPWTLALLTNPEVIAIDQDSPTTAARPVLQEEGRQIWIRELSDGSMALGAFNTDDFDLQVDVSWSGLGLSGTFRVRDLWQRRDLGRFRSGIKLSVPAHGAQLLRLSKANPAGAKGG